MKCAYCDSSYKGDSLEHCINCGAPKDVKQDGRISTKLMLAAGALALLINLHR